MTPSSSIQVATSIAALDAAQWDACANPPAGLADGADDGDRSGERFNPFLSHAFLQALETSGSVGARTGWSPAHVVIKDAGRMVAAAPTYLKSNSQGEYVFDHAWADAFTRAGGRYYPKLQVAVPFTPATGTTVPRGRRPGPVETAVRTDRRPSGPAPGGQGLVHPCDLRDEGRMGRLRSRGLAAEDRPAVPLHQRRLRRLR